MFEGSNVAHFNEQLIRCMADYLDLRCKIITMKKDNSLAGEPCVLEMCKQLGATHYINPIGGIDLCNKEAFEKKGNPAIQKHRGLNENHINKIFEIMRSI